MDTYKGILDGMDLRIIGLKKVLDNTFENTRKVLEEGFLSAIGLATRVVMHLSLLDRYERLYCLSYSKSDIFGDPVHQYLENEYRLKNKEKGLIWATLESKPPNWLELDPNNPEISIVKDFNHSDVKHRAINLVYVGEGLQLFSVLFYRIRVEKGIVGTLAVDFYANKPAPDIRGGIPLYRTFLDSLSSIISLVIEGMHMAYYDLKLNGEEMKRIFGQAYLLTKLEKTSKS